MLEALAEMALEMTCEAWPPHLVQGSGAFFVRPAPQVEQALFSEWRRGA